MWNDSFAKTGIAWYLHQALSLTPVMKAGTVLAKGAKRRAVAYSDGWSKSTFMPFDMVFLIGSA